MKMGPEMDVTLSLSAVRPQSRLNDVADILDKEQLWKRLAGTTRHPAFMLSNRELDTIGRVVCQLAGSPGRNLIKKWAERSMTVAQLIELLEALRVESALVLLKDDERLMMTQQPAAQVIVLLGEPLRLHCAAAGFPYPKYTWFNGSTQIGLASSTTGTMIIKSACANNSGTYTCRVHNSRHAWVFSERCVVIVTGAPTAVQINDVSSPSPSPVVDGRSTLRILKQPSDVPLLRKSSQLRLTCEATAGAPLRYHWFHNNQQLRDQTSNVLQVDQVDMSNAGSYYCIVRSGPSQLQTRTVKVTVSAGQLNQVSEDPVIISQPGSRTETVGAELQLSVCVARSCCAYKLAFEWLHNGHIIKGASESVLRRRVTGEEVAGRYQCWVYHEDGQQRRVGGTMSQEAVVTVTMPEYTAKDKVVLILGVANYRVEPLAAVKNDMHHTSICFEEMGFKVIALLDATLPEMWEAVRMFCSYLDKGVYGVFYFSGHGFRYQGQHYFLPYDAPTRHQLAHCLCAEQIQFYVQQKNPAVFLAISECCHIENGMIQEQVPNEKRFIPAANGNDVIVHSSSYGEKSYEPKRGHSVILPIPDAQGPQGIFSCYLCPLLRRKERMPIFNLFTKLQSEFSRNPYADSYPQHPSVQTNLTIPRTLCDPIEHSGHTTEMEASHFSWETMHDLPEKSFIATDCGMKIEIAFKRIFSNVFSMTVCCGSLLNALVDINDKDIPMVLLPIHRKRDATRNTTQFGFGNLQRLCGELTLLVTFTFQSGISCAQTTMTHRIHVGWPLISVLNRPVGAGAGGVIGRGGGGQWEEGAGELDPKPPADSNGSREEG